MKNLDAQLKQLVSNLAESAPPPPPWPSDNESMESASGSPRRVLPVVSLASLVLVGAVLGGFLLLRSGARPKVEVGTAATPITATQALSTTSVVAGGTTTTTTVGGGSVAAGGDFSVGWSLGALTAGKVVAVVSDPVEVYRETDKYSVTRWTEVSVDEVLFSVDLASRGLPTVSVGDSLRLLERHDAGAGYDFDYEFPTSGPILVSLTLVDFEQIPDAAPLWTIYLAAAVNPDGSLAFLHKTHGSKLGEQFDKLTAELGWTRSPAELIAAWTAENRSNLGTGMDGPIETAFKAAMAQPTPLEVWNATDPRIRPLDPEVTPPEILAGLVETPVLIEVADQARQADRYLIIRTDLGVIHSAWVQAGSHPATFLAPPGSTWEVFIANDPTGKDETLVARISPGVWSAAVDRSRVLIQIDAATVLTPSPITDQDNGPEGFVSIIDPETAQRILAQWAQP